MEHIVYCDEKAGELNKLLAGSKTMVIRGAAGRKLPYGRVHEGESVYLLENDSSGLIRAKAMVSDTIHSDRVSPEESAGLIEAYMDRLQLTESQLKRWSGKRYLCLVGLKDVRAVEPFSYEREKNMDDWIMVENIDSIKK
ncbi:MAG: hypothetical protein ACQEV0_11640 [Bacillota bacterium]